MAPPAKRQKKLVVWSSDDEEQDTKSLHKPIPTRSRTERVRKRISRPGLATQQGPDVLPTDHDAKPKSASEAQTSKPISSFFGAVTQAQPLEPVTLEVGDHEDVIVDDSPVENVNDLGEPPAKTPLDRRKKRTMAVDDNPSTMKKLSLHGGSQKFKIPEHVWRRGIIPGVSGVVRAEPSAVDMRPWAEKYGPNNLEELMVHKKKVSDVRTWLENALWGHDRKVRFSLVFAVVLADRD